MPQTWDWQTVLNLFATVFTVAAAIAAWRSANAASRAAHETHQGTQAQLLNSFLDAYASTEMLSAMIELRRWKSAHSEVFADEFRRLRREDYDKIKGVDQARRHVSHYFQKVHTIHAAGIIDENVLRAAATQGQVAFFREVIEPLEAALSPDYDRSSFDALGALYGIPRQLPPMANP